MSRKKIALIDGDVLVYQAAFGVEKNIDWGDGVHTLHADEGEAREAVDQLVSDLLEATEADEYHMALTCHDTKNFRKEVYPQDKENRTKVRKPLVWKFLREHLMEKYHAQTKPNLEADDIIGIWATKKWPKNPELLVVSIDKDFKSIPCTFFHMREGTTVVVTEPVADFNFYMQVLTGDRVDNYPGCPGVGPKKAEAILQNSIAKCDGDENSAMWRAVVRTFQKNHLNEAYAITQAQCARILRACDYDFTNKKPKLWSPSS